MDASNATMRLNAALSGRYIIERELGVGGMATVYLAHDVRHERKVALKVLHPELAAVVGAERFLQEIRVTAGLQHPHILPLFDSGQIDGRPYYVMPFVEGESLRERLQRDKQLPIDEAVRIATAVASALDSAHERGIIHRDVKPENILLSRGEALVADFGIARALSSAGRGRLTETGLSLGTPHYMSPEQATGDRDVGPATDVYSLGCVVYEMIAGEPPFTGATTQAVIAKILTSEPARLTSHRRSVPAHVDAAVACALEKLPADRFSSVRAFSRALSDATFQYDAVRPMRAGQLEPVHVARLRRDRSLSWGVAGALAALSVVLLWREVARTSSPPGDDVTRVDLKPIAGREALSITGLDVSPDGSMIVYAASDSIGPSRAATPVRLYLRQRSEKEARAIAGTEGASSPTFSPDNKWIAYALPGQGIRRIPPGGGSPEVVLADTVTPTNIRWGDNDTLYYFCCVVQQAGRVGIYRVSSRSGQPKRVVARTSLALSLLPDGRSAITHHMLGDSGRTMAWQLLDLETGRLTRLPVTSADEIQYVPTGHLLVRGPAGLWGVPFDLRRLEVTGDPIPVLDSVSAGGSITAFALSKTGTAVYVVRPAPGRAPPVGFEFVDRLGHEQSFSIAEQDVQYPSFSRDGRRLAYVTERRQLVVQDVLVGKTTRLTDTTALILSPRWFPSGDRVVFGIRRDLRDTLTVIASASAESGKVDTLFTHRGQALPRSFTPDGGKLLYDHRGHALGEADLFVASFDGTAWTTEPYLNAPWRETDGTLSQDGRWVLYRSNELSRQGGPLGLRSYVRSFPVPGKRFDASGNESFGNGTWGPNNTIYYWTAGELMAATVETSGDFRVVTRTPLFRRSPIQYTDFAVRPDGNLFLVSAGSTYPANGSGLPDTAGRGGATGESRRPHLWLVVNWLTEFKQKVEGK